MEIIKFFNSDISYIQNPQIFYGGNMTLNKKGKEIKKATTKEYSKKKGVKKGK